MDITVSRYDEAKDEPVKEIMKITHKDNKIAATIAANRIAHVNHREVRDQALALKVGQSFVVTVSTTRGSYHYERTA